MSGPRYLRVDRINRQQTQARPASLRNLLRDWSRAFSQRLIRTHHSRRGLLRDLFTRISNAIASGARDAKAILEDLNRYVNEFIKRELRSRDPERVRAAQRELAIINEIKRAISGGNQTNQTTLPQNRPAEFGAVQPNEIANLESFDVIHELFHRQPRADRSSSAERAAGNRAETQRPSTTADLFTRFLLSKLLNELNNPNSRSSKAPVPDQKASQELIDVLDQLSVQFREALRKINARQQQVKEGKPISKENTTQTIKVSHGTQGLTCQLILNAKGEIIGIKLEGTLKQPEMVEALRAMVERNPAENLPRIIDAAQNIVPNAKGRDEIQKVIAQVFKTGYERATAISHLDTAGGKVLESIPGIVPGQSIVGGNIDKTQLHPVNRRVPAPAAPPKAVPQKPVVNPKHVQLINKIANVLANPIINQVANSQLARNTILKSLLPQKARTGQGIQKSVLANKTSQQTILQIAVNLLTRIVNGQTQKTTNLTPSRIAEAIVGKNASKIINALVPLVEAKTPEQQASAMAKASPTVEAVLSVVAQTELVAEAVGMLESEGAQHQADKPQLRGNIPVAQFSEQREKPAATPKTITEIRTAVKDLLKATEANSVKLPEKVIEGKLYSAVERIANAREAERSQAGLGSIAEVGNKPAATTAAGAAQAAPEAQGDNKTKRLRNMVEILERTAGDVAKQAKPTPKVARAAKAEFVKQLNLTEGDQVGFEHVLEFLVGVVAHRVGFAAAENADTVLKSIRETTQIQDLIKEVREFIKAGKHNDVTRFINDLVLMANLLSLETDGVYTARIVDNAISQMVAEVRKERERARTNSSSSQGGELIDLFSNEPQSAPEAISA